jgi:uncharacterized membrane protein
MAKIQRKKSSLLLASAAAGLMTLAMTAGPDTAQAEGEGEKVKCYGANKCKGTGECGGKGHSCAGKNECAGHGWTKMTEEECLKLEGGRLTPEAPAAAE